MSFNQQRNQPFNDTTEDNNVSINDYEDDDNNFYMNKKELILLENDKSLPIDFDYDDDHTMSNKQIPIFRQTSKQPQLKSPKDQSQRRQSNELMKYISDSTIYYDRTNPRSSKSNILIENMEQKSDNNPLYITDNISNFGNIIQPIETKIQNNYFNVDIDVSKSTISKNKMLSIDGFQCCFLGNFNIKNSIASFGAVPTFVTSQSKQIEKDNKDLESHCDEVLKFNYWKKFYIDIIKLVKPESANDNDCYSEQFRFSIIEEVKNLKANARNKIFKIFETSNENNFIIWGNDKKQREIKILFKSNEISNMTIKGKKKTLSINTVKRFELNEMEEKLENEIFIERDEKISGNKSKSKIPKQYLKSEEMNLLPPIRYKKKISEGINTELTGDIYISNINSKEKEKEEAEKTKKDAKIQTIALPKVQSKRKFDKDKIKQQSNQIILTFSGKRHKPKSQPKTKKLNTKEVQTDFTMKNIESLEIMNKDCSNQLEITKKEKEKMKKQYEDKISELNEQIEENKTNNGNSNNISVVDPISLFLPEMIPPEQTYKIFMHCVKHFKYEEEIYKNNMEEDDLKCLKSFVNKMEKYIIGTSVPFQNNPNKKLPSIMKYKESILTGIKPIRNINYENYNTLPYPERQNNSTYMKYKTAIQNIKNH